VLDISNCKNISEVARKIYGKNTGGNRRKAERLLRENNIDPKE